MQCDQKRIWSYWMPKDGSEEDRMYVADECLQLLRDDHHAIRLLTVQSLHVSVYI